MLFRTVYGPELEAVYRFILASENGVSKAQAHRVFMAESIDSRSISTQSVDDALSFLTSANLIHEKNDSYVARSLPALSFRLAVLMQARSLQLGEIEPKHPTDPLYMLLLDELFLKLNRVFVSDLHAEANRLREVKDVGGLSREKLQAWRRVMSYLGTGWRVGDGFICAYASSLLEEILDAWEYDAGPLQAFLETHLGKFLPFQTSSGDLPDSIGQSLLYLAQKGRLLLETRYDSPTPTYFGERRLRHLVRMKEAR